MKHDRKGKHQATAIQKSASTRDLRTVVGKRIQDEPMARAKSTIQILTGTRTDDAASRFLRQAVRAIAAQGLKVDDATINTALDLMAELAPQNALQAMLAVQIISVHEAALQFLRNASVERQDSTGSNASVLWSTRLMRLFIDQLEAMSRLKGQPSLQRVVVERVNVFEGGQAVVGNVATRATRGEG